jgi:hypothetical protein
MSYSAIGYDIEVDIPLVGRKVVSFDLDKVAADASAAFMDKGWPLLEARAQQALPAFVQQAITEATPAMHRERDLAINKAASTLIVAGVAAAGVLGIAWWLSSGSKTKAASAKAW